MNNSDLNSVALQLGFFVDMSLRRLLAISRIMAVLLFFNMASSSVMASMNTPQHGESQQFTLLCTSQGLLQVAIDAESEPAKQVDTSLAHCVYCKFVDHPVSLTDPGLPSPQPESFRLHNYLAPLTSMTLKPILSDVYLRAPPLSTLV